MSELTVQATECFADTISASCNSVDATIKNTYALLAKVSSCFVSNFWIKFRKGVEAFSALQNLQIEIFIAFWQFEKVRINEIFELFF